MSTSTAQAAAPAAATDTSSLNSETSLNTDISENQELQTDLDSSPENADLSSASASQAKNNRKKLKLKVDGQEIDEEVDLDNEEYLVKQLQMAKMSQRRAQEAAELRKKIDAIGDYLEQAKGDKKKIRNLIKDLGVDEREIAAAILEEEIANSQKSPEQLERERLQEELQAIKDQQKRERDEWEAAERERLYGQEAERYDLLVSQAIETSDLPKSPYVVKKMAEYMLLGLENGIDVHPNDVINLVREEIEQDIQQMFSAMPEEVVEKIIGKNVLGKLRKRNVARAKSQQPPVPVKSSIKDVGQRGSDDKPTEKKTFKQFFGV